MKIIKVTPRGYCKGVVRAIQTAKQARHDYPHEKITILGMLVHNQYVVEALKHLGIDTIEDKTKTRMQLLDEIDEGIVKFKAHGIANIVKEQAIAKGLQVIDASCYDVIATQEVIKKALTEGKQIAYVGKRNHPEAEAVLAISDTITLVEVNQPLPVLAEPLFVTCQTTMSLQDVHELFDQIKAQYPNAEICEEICNATRVRQQAVRDLKDVDVLIVVGDPQSNNSSRLADIGELAGIKHVYRIEDAFQLQHNWFKESDTVAVTAGASTPSALTQQVIDALNGLPITPIDLNKLL